MVPSECAYAGCVPVGALPLSFTPEMSAHVLPLYPDRIKPMLQEILSMPEAETGRRAQAYRDLMRRERDVAVLNQRFQLFLERFFGM